MKYKVRNLGRSDAQMMIPDHDCPACNQPFLPGEKARLIAVHTACILQSSEPVVVLTEGEVK